MNPNLPKSNRRQGFYIPDPKRGKTKKKSPTDDEITEIFRKEIEQKEKESKKRNIEWKFIKEPHPSRLTITTESGEKYLFSDRTIEKIVFGDYFFIKHLMRISSNACFIYPDLLLAIDAIRLIYDIQSLNIPFDWENWDNMEKMIEKYPIFHERYLNTKYMIKNNFKEIKNILKPTIKGPRLNSKVSVYDKLIYSLIERMLEKERIQLDVFGKNEFEIPNFSRLLKCLQLDKRYIVFFLRLKIKDSYHANMMIIDTQNKTIERFEPQGSQHDFYDNELVDEKIKAYMNKNDMLLKYEYIGPKDFCPYGVQDIIEEFTVDKYQMTGFCKTWSFLYALAKLNVTEEMNPKELSENMIPLVKQIAKDFFEARYKKEIKGKEEEEYDYVIEFLYDYIPEILEEGKEDIQKMNEILDTNIVLEGRVLKSEQK